MLGFVATMLLACGTAEVVPEPVPEPVVEPAPEPEPEPAAPAEMTPEALNAARDANVGKMVTVKGFYSTMMKSDAPPQITVPVYQDAEAAGASVTCVFDVAKEAEVAALVAKAEITVSGTVSTEKAGETAKLELCSLVPAAAAPVEEGSDGPAKAKGGKGKGKQKAH